MSLSQKLNATLSPAHRDKLVTDCARIDDLIASGGRTMPFQPKVDVLETAPKAARILYEKLNDENIAFKLQERMGVPAPDNSPATRRETISAMFDVLGDK